MVTIPSVLYTPVYAFYPTVTAVFLTIDDYRAVPAAPLHYPPYFTYYKAHEFEFYNDPVTGALLTRPRATNAWATNPRYETGPVVIPKRSCINDCAYTGMDHQQRVPRSNRENCEFVHNEFFGSNILANVL